MEPLDCIRAVVLLHRDLYHQVLEHAVISGFVVEPEPDLIHVSGCQ